MTGFAICGVGNIGQVHLENLLSLRGCRVCGLFDTDARQIERVTAHSDLHSYGSIDELLHDPQVDAVVIATPSSSHKQIYDQALQAGKHVFVEKPLAGTLQDAEAMVATSKQTNRVIQVGFCERFNANYLEAKKAVHEGRLGRIRSIYSSRVAPYGLSDPNWDLGVLDTGVHNLDLILWLMGCSPASVLAKGVQVYSDSAIPHAAAVVLNFQNGAMAVDYVAWLKDHHHPLSQCARSRMLIQGDSGAFEIDLSDRPSCWLDDQGFHKVDSVILGSAEYAGCLKLQFEYFLRSVEEGAPVLASVEEALTTERVAMAALDSLRRGREVQLMSAPQESSR